MGSRDSCPTLQIVALEVSLRRDGNAAEMFFVELCQAAPVLCNQVGVSVFHARNHGALL